MRTFASPWWLVRALDIFGRRSRFSLYERGLLGNLGFSKLYALSGGSPAKIIDAYHKMYIFMNEPDRQLVLENFVVLYPKWPSDKQEEFTRFFHLICDHVKTVELARMYYDVMGEKAKRFFGFAMLQMPFSMDEIYLHFGVRTLNNSFFKFPDTPKDDGERKAAWTANQTLIANLPLSHQLRENADLINSIKLGDTEAVRGISIEVMCRLLKAYERDYYESAKWINLIWSKLEVVDAQRLLENSPIPFGKMSFSARFALVPQSAFPVTYAWFTYQLEEETLLLERVIYDLCNSSSSGLRDVFEQALQSYIVSGAHMHSKVLIATLHFYSVKGDSEMIKILEIYFFLYPFWSLDRLGGDLPLNSPVWAGRLGVAYTNLVSDSDQTNYTFDFDYMAISNALLGKNEAFIHQLRLPVSNIRQIAYECGAIPLRYSKERFETVLAENISKKSREKCIII